MRESELALMRKLHEIKCSMGRCPHYDDWWHRKVDDLCRLSREIREAYGWSVCAMPDCQYDGPSYESFYNGPFYCPDHARYTEKRKPETEEVKDADKK